MGLILALLTLGAGAYFMLKGEELPPRAVMNTTGEKVTGPIKIQSGLEVIVNTEPQVYGAMLQAASTNDPAQMAVMANMLASQGAMLEAEAMKTLASAQAAYLAGKKV